ncbi:hypothetical protein ACTFIZ_006196 [Dictyostelium cf. discoideum]
MFKKILLFTLTFAIFALANCDNTLSITQIQKSAWEGHTGWDVTILNNDCCKTVIDAIIIPESNFFPSEIWSIEKLSENKYHFPDYITKIGLGNGTKFTFGYINKSGTPAIFNILDVKFQSNN